jgi:hypothetical protein
MEDCSLSIVPIETTFSGGSDCATGAPMPEGSVAAISVLPGLQFESSALSKNRTHAFEYFMSAPRNQ